MSGLFYGFLYLLSAKLPDFSVSRVFSRTLRRSFRVRLGFAPACLSWVGFSVLMAFSSWFGEILRRFRSFLKELRVSLDGLWG